MLLLLFFREAMLLHLASSRIPVHSVAPNGLPIVDVGPNRALKSPTMIGVHIYSLYIERRYYCTQTENT